MQFQSDSNKSGLTFSFNDVNFDSSSLNLVPILLETPETEVIISDKYPDNQNNLYGSNQRKLNLYSDNVAISNSRSQQEMPHYSDFNIPVKDTETKVAMTNNVQETYPVGNYSDNFVAPTELTTDSTSQLFDVQDNNLSNQYEPVSYYWFYCVIVNGLAEWKPFSIKDSNRIELKFCQYFKNLDTYDLVDDCVPTEGGRYDVFIRKRQKVSVYWEEAPMEIRRASWFYRPEDESFYLPYSELECNRLEDKFKYVLENGLWHQPFELASGGGGSDRCVDDKFVFHSSNTMVEYRRCGYLSSADADSVVKGRIVYRGVEAFRSHLEPGESDIIDHVMFVIHGIGPICDMGGRGIVECVKAMRSISAAMMKTHFPSRDRKGRVELLPVSWHGRFHSCSSSSGSIGGVSVGANSGGGGSDRNSISIDRHLQKLTLQSVPKLRNFTNSTLVDVLCYSSPRYCATILSIVASEMNRLRHLFVSRNPQYDGPISIAGHSLGSMIAMDLVALQDSDGKGPDLLSSISKSESCELPPLQFDVGLLFALGSPISLLLTARGHSFLGPEFRLARCKGFFNIFHPLDPVAYRLEPMLMEPLDLCNRVARPPVVIAHHKGRKRLHLELKENLARVGHDIKSRLLLTLRKTWSSLQEFANSHSAQQQDPSLLMGGQGRDEQDTEEMMRVLRGIDNDDDSGDSGDSALSGGVSGAGPTNAGAGVADKQQSVPSEQDDQFGAQLNGGRRVDYVLQEAPLESFNDYLFALGSHSCYWDSEDAMLMMLREIYRTLQLDPYSRINESPDDLLMSATGPSGLAGPSPPPLMPQMLPSRPPIITDASSLPQTFQQMPSKPFFVPCFSSDDDPLADAAAADEARRTGASECPPNEQRGSTGTPSQLSQQQRQYHRGSVPLDQSTQVTVSQCTSIPTEWHSLDPGKQIAPPPRPMPPVSPSHWQQPSRRIDDVPIDKPSPAVAAATSVSDWSYTAPISDHWRPSAQLQDEQSLAIYPNDRSDNNSLLISPQSIVDQSVPATIAVADIEPYWSMPQHVATNISGGPPPLPRSDNNSSIISPQSIVDQSVPATDIEPYWSMPQHVATNISGGPPPLPLASPSPIMTDWQQSSLASGNASGSNQSMGYLQYPPMLGNELVNVFQPSPSEGLDYCIADQDVPFHHQPDWASTATGPQLPDISATSHTVIDGAPRHSLPSILQHEQQRKQSDTNLYTPAELERQAPPAVRHVDSLMSSLSDRHTDHRSHKIDPPRPQRKLSQELPASYSCRTPSPRTLPPYQSIRNSPRSAGGTAPISSSSTTNTPSSIFSSKPLVPQSGRLFNKK